LAILRPRVGVCGGVKIFGSALLQPVRSVCVSLSAFFIQVVLEYWPLNEDDDMDYDDDE